MLADKKASIVRRVTIENGTPKVNCLARCPNRYGSEDVILTGRNNNPAGLREASGIRRSKPGGDGRFLNSARCAADNVPSGMRVFCDKLQRAWVAISFAAPTGNPHSFRTPSSGNVDVIPRLCGDHT
jgi:hypothetical protein